MTNEINILLENSIENAILSLNDEIDDLLPPLHNKSKCQQGLITQECRLKLEKMRGEWSQRHEPKTDPLQYWDHTSILVKTVQIGNGKKVSYGDTVIIHYSIHRLDGLTLYISPKRFRFNMLDPQVIAGLRLGIRRMRVGELAKLYIPAEMAYGWKGLEGLIDPHTDIIIRVSLRRIVSKPNN